MTEDDFPFLGHFQPVGIHQIVLFLLTLQLMLNSTSKEIVPAHLDLEL